MRKSILSIFLLFLGLAVNAQFNNLDRNQKKVFLDAESFYQYGDYVTAIKIYKSIEKSAGDFPEFYFTLANSYFNLKVYDSAFIYLPKGLSYSNDANYLLAYIHLYNGELELAEEKIKLFKTTYDEKKDKISLEKVDRLKDQINYAREIMMKPEVVNIINLGSKVNSEEAEYGPLISSDETILIYTSRRETETNGIDPTGQPFEDVYSASKDLESNTWEASTLISGEVNTPKHDAAVGLSPEGERLFIYRSSDNLEGGDIYESKFQNDKWTTPVRMSPNINDYRTIEPSASLALDGKTFYFSSNREDGYGGFDIYRVVLLPNGKWSLPKNLGPTINTKYNDDGPFIHPDGKTLYFSSQGHKNMGGYDIFKSTFKDSVWTEPENLGFPTNTTKDDVYFVISANEQHGYYSSDKLGGFGKQDLYMIDYLERSLRSSVVRGVIKDKDGNPISADVSVIEVDSGELNGVYVSNPKNGKFIFLVNPNVDYELLIEAEGYPEFFEDVNYDIEELKKPQYREFELSK